MTAPRDIITIAMRKVGVLAAGEVPDADDLADALDRYNGMVGGMFGQQIGTRCIPYVPPAGGPVTVDPGRLFLVGQAAVTLLLPASPREGARFGIADSTGNLAANSCTINPNGMTIAYAYGQAKTSANINLATNGQNQYWFFRADLGTWQPEGAQAVDDPIFFPQDVIEALSDMLAVRLGSEYGEAASVSPQLVAMSNAGVETIARRYSRRGRTQRDPARGVAPVQNLNRAVLG